MSNNDKLQSTPRTDAEVKKNGTFDVTFGGDAHLLGSGTMQPIVSADFARQLEREAAAWRALAERNFDGSSITEYVQQLEREAEAVPSANRTLTTDSVLNAMQDHYWDSLEPNRDIVLKHIESVLRLFDSHRYVLVKVPE